MEDKEKAIVYKWIEAMQANGKGDPELEAVLYEAYDNNEHHKSNGCNLVNELSWPFPRHPACVVHDMLYRLKLGRSYSDATMRRLNAYFGRSCRGWVRWAGLRLGGWWAYNQ